MLFRSILILSAENVSILEKVPSHDAHILGYLVSSSFKHQTAISFLSLSVNSLSLSFSSFLTHFLSFDHSLSLNHSLSLFLLLTLSLSSFSFLLGAEDRKYCCRKG